MASLRVKALSRRSGVLASFESAEVFWEVLSVVRCIELVVVPLRRWLSSRLPLVVTGEFFRLWSSGEFLAPQLWSSGAVASAGLVFRF